MDLRLPAALLSVVILTSAPTQAQTNRRYIPVETDAAYIYLDEGGVAVKAEKNFACRNVGWASTADPKVFSMDKYAEFRQSQIDSATWDQWLCKPKVGPVVFSREILEAQRKLNMAPNKPGCSLWVPETGRLNWEMLEFDRCLLSTRLGRVQAALTREFTARLADFTGSEIPEESLSSHPAQVPEELVARAREEKLDIFVEECGRIVPNAYDLAACQLHKRLEHMQEAERLYGRYAERIAVLRGTPNPEQSVAKDLAADSAAVRRQLRGALDE